MFRFIKKLIKSLLLLVLLTALLVGGYWSYGLYREV